MTVPDFFEQSVILRPITTNFVWLKAGATRCAPHFEYSKPGENPRKGYSVGPTVDLFRQALKTHPAPTRHQIHHQIERTIVAGPIAALCGHRRHLPRSSCV